MSRSKAPALFRGWLILVLVALALPVLSMILLSFNASRYGTLPFSFSLHWYEELQNDGPLIEALQVSVNLATQTTIICVIVGTLLTFGLQRAALVITGPVNALLLALLTVPAIILAAGLVQVFSWLGLSQTSAALVLASVVTSVPFVVLIETGRLQGLSPDFAEAARTLGAGRLRTFVLVTAPLMAPSIVAGALLAFVICFNNFAVQLFIAPIGLSTLPVQIYSMVRLGVTPDVNALGSLIVVGTVILIVALERLTGGAARLFTASTPPTEK